MNDEAVYRTAPATPGLLIRTHVSSVTVPIPLSPQEATHRGCF